MYILPETLPVVSPTSYAIGPNLALTIKKKIWPDYIDDDLAILVLAFFEEMLKYTKDIELFWPKSNFHLLAFIKHIKYKGMQAMNPVSVLIYLRTYDKGIKRKQGDIDFSSDIISIYVGNIITQKNSIQLLAKKATDFLIDTT